MKENGMFNPLDYFDTYGFPTQEIRFSTLEDLDSSAHDFYNEVFADRINDPDLLRQVFRDWADERGYSELDRKLMAAALIENYGVKGMSVFE